MPIFIVTEEEAIKNESVKDRAQKHGILEQKMFVILPLHLHENSFGMLWVLSLVTVQLWRCPFIQKRVIHCGKNIQQRLLRIH